MSQKQSKTATVPYTVDELNAKVDQAVQTKVSKKLSDQAVALMNANTVLISMGNEPIQYPDAIQTEIDQYNTPSTEIEEVTAILDAELERLATKITTLTTEKAASMASFNVAIRSAGMDYKGIEKARKRLTGKTSVKAIPGTRASRGGYTWMDYFRDSHGRTPSGKGGRNGSYGNENRLAQNTITEGYKTPEEARTVAIKNGIIVIPDPVDTTTE